MQYEEPAEAVRAQWERLKFPATMRHAEDMDHMMEKILKARLLMIKYGVVRLGEEASMSREMADLRRMIPRGSELHRFYAGKDYQVTTFEQWFQLLDQFKAMLPRRHEEKRVVTRRAGSGDRGTFEEDEEGTSEEEEKSMELQLMK